MIIVINCSVTSDCLCTDSSPRGPSERLAVMVMATGESYDWSSGSWQDGTVLASLADVVVVTLTHRLGLFGQ